MTCTHLDHAIKQRWKEDAFHQRPVARAYTSIKARTHLLGSFESCSPTITDELAQRQDTKRRAARGGGAHKIDGEDHRLEILCRRRPTRCPSPVVGTPKVSREERPSRTKDLCQSSKRDHSNLSLECIVDALLLAKGETRWGMRGAISCMHRRSQCRATLTDQVIEDPVSFRPECPIAH